MPARRTRRETRRLPSGRRAVAAIGRKPKVAAGSSLSPRRVVGRPGQPVPRTRRRTRNEMPVVTVFGLAIIEIWLAVPAGLALGVPPVALWLATLAGSLLSVTVVAFGATPSGRGWCAAGEATCFPGAAGCTGSGSATASQAGDSSRRLSSPRRWAPRSVWFSGLPRPSPCVDGGRDRAVDDHPRRGGGHRPRHRPLRAGLSHSRRSAAHRCSVRVGDPGVLFGHDGDATAGLRTAEPGPLGFGLDAGAVAVAVAVV